MRPTKLQQVNLSVTDVHRDGRLGGLEVGGLVFSRLKLTGCKRVAGGTLFI
jgi:hypothetical protein